MFNDKEAFLALVKDGLWETDIWLSSCEGIDYDEVLQFAVEQSVVGLVAAGLEKLPTGILPLMEKLKFVGMCQLIEQRNQAMNCFVADLVHQMSEAGINAVLVKGQGIAQCYERPLWRSSGDVDFMYYKENYLKAKQLFLPVASEAGKEFEYNQHQSLTIGSYTVELHGSQRCGLSGRMDAVIDELQCKVCEQGKIRLWMNNGVPVMLPAPDEDVILVFTHFLKHFYKGGLGLRQICDWCRLLWTYRETIDWSLLEARLREIRLISEWKVFGAFSVEYLGMPVKAMPIFDGSNRWKRKAKKIEEFIMMSGNFGHNRDSSYWTKYPYLIRKAFSMKRRVGDLISHAKIFPLDSFRFFPSIVGHGLRSAARGE